MLLYTVFHFGEYCTATIKERDMRLPRLCVAFFVNFSKIQTKKIQRIFFLKHKAKTKIIIFEDVTISQDLYYVHNRYFYIYISVAFTNCFQCSVFKKWHKLFAIFFRIY